MARMVAGRRVDFDELLALARAAKEALWEQAASLGRHPAIYLHWSAGHYHQFYDSYHVNIDDDGMVYVTTNDFSELKSHTWQRNSGSIGVALACCAFCTTNQLGKEGPTNLQIESMARVVAILTEALAVPIDLYHVMTHAEAADCLDCPDDPLHERYGPETTCERWDLWFLKDGEDRGSGGPVLRGKALWYQQNGIQN